MAELGSYVDGLPTLVTWRQGRCMPYGEGITFWALGEILKAHAGILESDTSEVAIAKLEAVLPERERPWFRQRLLPYSGSRPPPKPNGRSRSLRGGGSSSTSPSSIQRCSFSRICIGPTPPCSRSWNISSDRAEGGAASRGRHCPPGAFRTPPQVRQRDCATPRHQPRPADGGETARLVSALLETDRRSRRASAAESWIAQAETLSTRRSSCGLLKDKDLLIKRGSSWELRDGAEVPFPDSVQALIAARLDALPPDAKSMLADAAVIGKVFWAGAIAHMAQRDLTEVTETLKSSHGRTLCATFAAPRSRVRPSTPSCTS